MNDPHGSKWRKWDLHFHTPKSHDHGNKDMSAKDIVDRLVDADVEVVAVTDHHVMDVAFIEEMRQEAGDSLTVLPGIELACPLGGNHGVHFIGIFSEECNLQHIANELLTRLGVNEQLARGVDIKKVYVDFIRAAPLIRDLGGLVSMHARGKASSIECIANNSALKEQFKQDIFRQHINMLEVGRHEYQNDYKTVVFQNIGLQKPLIIGSDDHADDRYQKDKRYPDDKHCWLRADPTFAGLKMALREPEHRFCLDAVPPDVERVEKNKTKYIQSVSFRKLETMPPGEEWLHGDVPLNPGLVAIIGNKGSGKSALADCIGLLGSCTTSDAFSFLEKKRFQHPRTGRAQHVQAIMSWHGGDLVTRLLDDIIELDEPERVKYLPQNFVERVCNDLALPDGGEFEKELKKVVFSKVADADRLDMHTLDDLVKYRTEELRDEADGKAHELVDLSEERARLEAQLDPAVKSGLEKKIERKNDEIESHEATKPEEVQKPADDPSADPTLTDSIESLENQKAESDKVAARVAQQNAIVNEQHRRASTAQKLLAKMENLRTTVERDRDGMFPEADALGLKPEELVTLSVADEPVKAIRNEAIEKRDSAREALGSLETEPPTGLLARQSDINKAIKVIQDKLSRPHQEYQAYLEAMKKWEAALQKLKGTEGAPDSLAGLETALKALDDVPNRIREIGENQENIANAIHALRVKEARVYTELYEPVQKFILEHPLAQDHLKLEFKVEIEDDGFAENLLSFINQNRVGSFYGSEDGEKAAKSLVSRVTWSDWDSVKEFLQSVVQHLHHDMREERNHEAKVLLGPQLAKGKSAAELYCWLYGLGYLSPRYLLRWDGKDVEQLSPGERGTLLLIFYLLVDDSDLPLIIDQPEANLDNATVAEKLVDCIRDARSRRQVIIVTHNPNLAVVCDADQIVHASMDKPAGNRITYDTGALEHPRMNRFTINVLEGGRHPFEKRDTTYGVTGA